MNNESQNGQRRVIESEVLAPDQPHTRQEARRPTFAYFQSYGWPMYSVDQNACLAPCVTVVLFLVCLFQYGFLAGLGFLFFHTLFGIAGTVRASRLLMAGQPFNVWLWRLGNWIFSFLLTIWLAGD